MHDIDDHLHDLLSSVAPFPPVGDQRSAIRALARRRQLRQRAAGAVVAVVVVCAGAVVLSSAGPERQSVTAGPSSRATATAERVVRLPGLAPIRVSTTNAPVHGFASFGSVPLGGGAITGAVETTRADGSVVVLVAVTAGPTTRSVIIRTGDGKPHNVPVTDAGAVVSVELPAKDLSLVVEVDALDTSGAQVGMAHVAPYLQDPIACDTNPQVVGDADAATGPTRIGALDAYLAAPLPAVCAP